MAFKRALPGMAALLLLAAAALAADQQALRWLVRWLSSSAGR